MDPHLDVLVYLGCGEAVVVGVLAAGKGGVMKTRALLLGALLPLLWAPSVHAAPT